MKLTHISTALNKCHIFAANISICLGQTTEKLCLTTFKQIYFKISVKVRSEHKELRALTDLATDSRDKHFCCTI